MDLEIRGELELCDRHVKIVRSSQAVHVRKLLSFIVMDILNSPRPSQEFEVPNKVCCVLGEARFLQLVQAAKVFLDEQALETGASFGALGLTAFSSEWSHGLLKRTGIQINPHE